MRKSRPKVRETRVGFAPAKRAGQALKARPRRKPKRVSTALVDRLIARAKAVTEGREKTIELTDLTDDQLMQALSGPAVRRK